MSTHTKRLSRKRTKLRKLFRRIISENNGIKPDTEDFIKLEEKLRGLDKDADEAMLNDRIRDQHKRLEISKAKRQNLFAHVKEAKGKPSTNIIGPVKDIRGTLMTADQDVANSFGELMGEQLKPREKFYIDWASPHPQGPKNQLNFMFVHPDAVKTQIKKSRNSAAPGPDGIPMEALAVAQDILAHPLAELFNLINSTGNVPRAFKQSRVKMLYKKSEKSDMLNYRPLAMSNHIAKLWERVVNSALMEHLEENKLLSEFQRGFRPNMGTTENLLQLWEHIIDKVETEGALIELWNFDLTKAFDKLNHEKVLRLLHKNGVYGPVGLSIQNWLINRDQYVEVGNSKSDQTKVGRSCVQGSVLGPTLWLLYINSLTEHLDSAGVQYHAYADDISIIQKIDTDEDREKFEKTLGLLQTWADKYDMQWSPLKTQRLVFKYQNCPDPHPPLEIFFGGKKIEPLARTCTSLGIQISKTCNFQDQIKKVANTIKSLTGLIRQNFANLTTELLQRYYQVYVLPTLIYCCQVWHSGDEVQLRAIEHAIEKYWKLAPTKTPTRTS